MSWNLSNKVELIIYGWNFAENGQIEDCTSRSGLNLQFPQKKWQQQQQKRAGGVLSSHLQIQVRLLPTLQASARCHRQPTWRHLRDRVLPRGLAMPVRQQVLHAIDRQMETTVTDSFEWSLVSYWLGIIPMRSYKWLVIRERQRWQRRVGYY